MRSEDLHRRFKVLLLTESPSPDQRWPNKFWRVWWTVEFKVEAGYVWFLVWSWTTLNNNLLNFSKVSNVRVLIPQMLFSQSTSSSAGSSQQSHQQSLQQQVIQMNNLLGFYDDLFY